MGDKYQNFATLAQDNAEDSDYRIVIQQRQNAKLLVIAPHGGSIERRTSEIASALAGNDHSLYLFEGIDPKGTFDTLHITSHRFDEPTCLQLVKQFSFVISVHGCSGEPQGIYLGGRDTELRKKLHKSLTEAGFATHNEEHRFQGTHPRNICNRGSREMGVQIEFSDGLRGAANETLAIRVIRDTLYTALL